MSKSLTYLFCALAAAGAAAYAAVQPPPDRMVLQHPTIIDGVTSDVRRDMTVVIRGGRIESVSRAAVVAAPDATVLDLQNRWLLPGIIDAHVHFRDLASARAALAAAVTTARSLGVDHFADIGHPRTASRRRRRFRTSSLPVTTPGGVCRIRSSSISRSIDRSCVDRQGQPTCESRCARWRSGAPI